MRDVLYHGAIETFVYQVDKHSRHKRAMFWIALLVLFLVAWLSVALIVVAHSLTMPAMLRIRAQKEARFGMRHHYQVW